MFSYQLMCNSLPTQYLFQAPDCHLFAQKVGCISGCASGILPVLEPDHRVLVNTNIIQQIKTLFCKDFGLLFIFLVNIIRGAHS